MDRAELYEQMAKRKSKPKDFEPYKGDNGRVNRALQLFKSGKLKTGEIHIDIGGGIGDLGFALRENKLFEKTLTVDISATNLSAAKKKGNFVVLVDIDKQGLMIDDPQCFGGDPEWCNSSFSLNSQGRIDAISALDFIEHIIDPVKFARECFHFLKPGGEVFINTPNIQFWKHQDYLRQTGRFPHTSGDTDVYHGGHLAFFTYLDLVEIFEAAGFRAFEQFNDEEGYSHPHETYIANLGAKNQQEYVQCAMRLGCPNLLFKATKP